MQSQHHAKLHRSLFQMSDISESRDTTPDYGCDSLPLQMMRTDVVLCQVEYRMKNKVAQVMVASQDLQSLLICTFTKSAYYVIQISRRVT